MKLSKLSLPATVLLGLCLTSMVPAWAGLVPVKRPSDYGVSGGQVQLSTPSFLPSSVNGVSIDLNSVFCAVNDCGGDPTTANLTYFFSIDLAPGSQLTSLTFGPGFDEASLSLSGPVEFVSADQQGTCASGTTYTCAVPFSTAGLVFPSTVADPLPITDRVSCISGICTMTFENFTYANINPSGIPGAKIIFGATTSFTDLSLNKAGVPQSTQVTVNGSVVSVTEPGALWFVAIAAFVCAGVIVKRRRTIFSSMEAC